CFFFFFFQAEDGIRDKLVTGVQTCALPILRRSAIALTSRALGSVVLTLPCSKRLWTRLRRIAVRCSVSRLSWRPRIKWLDMGTRSEERRVGKEWRGGGWAKGYVENRRTAKE